MKSFFAIAVLLVVTMAVAVARDFNCDNYTPQPVCTMDAMLFCLNNGTVVTGQCNAQRAVCLDKRGLDDTFAACGRGGGIGGQFNCEQYRANPGPCTKDLLPFCLTNGTVVRGICNAKRAVCIEHQERDDDFSSCNDASKRSGSGTQDTGDNSATAASATLSLAFGLLLSLLF